MGQGAGHRIRASVKIPCFGSLAPFGHTHRLLITGHRLVEAPLAVLSSPFESSHGVAKRTPLTSMENRFYARQRNDSSDWVCHGLE